MKKIAQENSITNNDILYLLHAKDQVFIVSRNLGTKLSNSNEGVWEKPFNLF